MPSIFAIPLASRPPKAPASEVELKKKLKPAVLEIFHPRVKIFTHQESW